VLVRVLGRRLHRHLIELLAQLRERVRIRRRLSLLCRGMLLLVLGLGLLRVILLKRRPLVVVSLVLGRPLLLGGLDSDREIKLLIILLRL